MTEPSFQARKHWLEGILYISSNPILSPEGFVLISSIWMFSYLFDSLYIFVCSIATMDLCVRTFKQCTGCSIVEAIEAATLHPAQVLNLVDSKGTILSPSLSSIFLISPLLSSLSLVSIIYRNIGLWKGCRFCNVG